MMPLQGFPLPLGRMRVEDMMRETDCDDDTDSTFGVWRDDDQEEEQEGCCCSSSSRVVILMMMILMVIVTLLGLYVFPAGVAGEQALSICTKPRLDDVEVLVVVVVGGLRYDYH